MIRNKNIDNGRAFDWGRTSYDYARYRDIYPEEFYRKILDKNLCIKGQKILDIGTGTGVIPRNLYRHGAEFIGIDISENQIAQARRLAEEQHMDIGFQCVSAEEIVFPAKSFDVVTACQCFPYFDHTKLAGRLHELLKQDGRFVIMYMAWLPMEDKIAGGSEELILKYNPSWSGCGETRHVLSVPKAYDSYFEMEEQELFDLKVPFDREHWNGRIKACRGVGASLPQEKIEEFDREHRKLLEENAPAEFEILHYAAITILRKK